MFEAFVWRRRLLAKALREGQPDEQVPDDDSDDEQHPQENGKRRDRNPREPRHRVSNYLSYSPLQSKPFGCTLSPLHRCRICTRSFRLAGVSTRSLPAALPTLTEWPENPAPN